MLTMDVQLPSILTSTLGANSGQIQAPATFASWKASSLPTGEEAEWDLLPVWTFWEKNIPCPFQRSDRDISMVQSVSVLITVPTGLSWLAVRLSLHHTALTTCIY